MYVQERRKNTRYDAFIPVTLFVPVSREGQVVEINAWIKNISEKGLALEIFISAPDEIKHFQKMSVVNRPINAVIKTNDGISIKVNCSFVWGNISKNNNFYNIGLLMEPCDSIEKVKLYSFIEELNPIVSK